MDNQKIGIFISELRKEKKMTQKELAAALHITDKAVSKWERGQSSPDISLLIPLSELLGVTTGELLNGSRSQDPSGEEATEKTLETAIIYAKKREKINLDRIRHFAFLILTAACMIGAIACMITDYCLTGRLTWSLVVLASLVFGWIAAAPMLAAKRRPALLSAMTISIGVFPYLYILGTLLHIPLVYTMGCILAVMGILDFWLIYLLLVRMPLRKLRAFSIWVLINIPLVLLTNYIISYFTKEQINSAANSAINSVSMLFLAAFLLWLDHRKSR